MTVRIIIMTFRRLQIWRYRFIGFEKRVTDDAKTIDFEIELTHCDEMDSVDEFKKHFNKVNTYDTPLI